ncbi:hypothetical protein [Streptomyces sp. NPDC054975]
MGGGTASYCAPALGVAHGRLYYALTGTDTGVYWGTFNDTRSSWNPAASFAGYTSQVAPALSSEYSGRLWLTHIGSDGQPNLNTHDGNRWSSHYSDTLGWKVEDPVALAPYGGRLWRLARGGDSKVYTSTSSGGSEWSYQGIANSTWRSPPGKLFSPGLPTHARGRSGPGRRRLGRPCTPRSRH